MRYQLTDNTLNGVTRRSVTIEQVPGQFTSFPTSLNNPAYAGQFGFLTQVNLTDAQVQAAAPDVWVVV